MPRIADLYAPIQKELAAVEVELQSVGRAGPPWLREMLSAVLFVGGKRMRPAISLLAGKAVQPAQDPSVPLAAALELLHTASLIHDDIIDSAGMRRGRPTASSLFDNHAAVVLGDYVFAQAAVLVALTGNVEVTRIFAQTMIDMAEAELAEDRVAFNYSQTIDDYLQRIRGKTAVLFAIAARGGALVSDADAEQAEQLRTYGENVGMAFQIVDDILDFSGDEHEMGKPVGSDLLQGTLTLPSLLLIQHHPDDNPVWRLFVERGNPEFLAKAISAVKESGIIDEAYETARRYRDRACDALSALTPSPERDSLAGLADYVLARRT